MKIRTASYDVKFTESTKLQTKLYDYYNIPNVINTAKTIT